VDARRIALPMYRSVMETIGKPVVFNICVLGVLIRLTKLVQPASILKVLGSRISPDWEEMNREALELGMKLSAKYM
jgi:2-oxoglutarate ferredoxin oxidoreductase subunit gamma